jgi:hypothetical protein
MLTQRASSSHALREVTHVVGTHLPLQSTVKEDNERRFKSNNLFEKSQTKKPLSAIESGCVENILNGRNSFRNTTSLRWYNPDQVLRVSKSHFDLSLMKGTPSG